MRSIFALGILIALCTSANAAKVHNSGACPTPGKHCADCDRYVDLKRQLGRLIGFNFFLGSPLLVSWTIAYRSLLGLEGAKSLQFHFCERWRASGTL